MTMRVVHGEPIIPFDQLGPPKGRSMGSAADAEVVAHTHPLLGTESWAQEQEFGRKQRTAEKEERKVSL